MLRRGVHLRPRLTAAAKVTIGRQLCMSEPCVIEPCRNERGSFFVGFAHVVGFSFFGAFLGTVASMIVDAPARFVCRISRNRESEPTARRQVAAFIRQSAAISGMGMAVLPLMITCRSTRISVVKRPAPSSHVGRVAVDGRASLIARHRRAGSHLHRCPWGGPIVRPAVLPRATSARRA